jgi:hypothetical protein
MVNLILWIVQVFLALFFLEAAVPKIIGRGLEQWTGFSDVPRPLVLSIGIAELFGAAGLVLPMATGILPWLTPLAGIGLAINVLMASGFHIRARHSLGIASISMIFPPVIVKLRTMMSRPRPDSRARSRPCHENVDVATAPVCDWPRRRELRQAASPCASQKARSATSPDRTGFRETPAFR